MASRYGAYPQDWNFLELVCGLTEDLLPVVSNQKVKISELSKMVGIGKTPSRFNGNGEAAGFSNWTQYRATPDNIEFWSGCEDYGICIQTRHLRAIDIDVPDAGLADAIRVLIHERLGYTPIRLRKNSGKCLLAFYVEGDMPKRSFKVREKVVDAAGKTVEPAWLVEFLANGQQFIAFGTHPSGARYEWEMNGHTDFPTLTLEQFEEIWAALVATFAIEKSETGAGARKRGADLNLDDPIARLLDEKGFILGEGNDGQLYIDCPWKDGHSSDTGIAQTCYFPRGTGGYERGHFKCLHASCAKYGDGEYENALGFRQLEMEGFLVDKSGDNPADSLEPEEAEPEPLPPLQRKDDGTPLAIPQNVTALLRRSDVMGIKLGFDEFRDEIMYAREATPAKWIPFKDSDYTRLRIAFDKMGFAPVGRELVRDCVLLVGEEHTFDSAKVWLSGVKWDGVPRIAGFMATYFNTPDTPYTRAVGCYVWSALAGRVMQPGVKADMAPILIGGQGLGKSTAIKAMAPGEEYFTEIDLGAPDADNARLMRGCLVAELAELKGLSGRELEAIRAFITRQHEKWTPKYKEFSSTYARRLIFLGTSNSDEILADETGNRRWLPVRVGACDVEGITRDREQLWAEGREHFEMCGVDYYAASTLGIEEHAAFMIPDEWRDAVVDWLKLPDMDETRPTDRSYLRVIDVMRGAFNLDVKHHDKRAQMRTAKILRELGYERRLGRIDENGEPIRAWFKKCE